MAKKPRILIVDDSQYQRSRAKKLLEESGFSVIEALDGIEGVCTFRKEAPDLVIMDINMPYMEGIEALEYIKKLDENAIVIMFTTLDDEKTIMKAIKAGAKDYIVKPLDPERMIATIRRFLGLAARGKD